MSTLPLKPKMIQCPHLLIGFMFFKKPLTRFSLSFQGYIGCVHRQVLPVCSAMASLCCWTRRPPQPPGFCALGQAPCLQLETQIPSLQIDCILLSLPGTGAVHCGPHRTGTKASSLLRLRPVGGGLATRIESTAEALPVTVDSI